MNDPLRQELEALKQAQQRLRLQMEEMDRRIEAVAEKLAKENHPAPAVEPPAKPPSVFEQAKIAPPRPEALPPEEWVAPQKKPAQEKTAPKETPPPLPVELPEVRPSQPAVTKPEPEPIEMKIGQFWLVRIGIVTILTGLVFFGRSWIASLGPAGKLSLLALTALALGGVAWFLHRKQESLRNYARVLGAGAAALGYYCAYAAHFVEPLRVIGSPLAGGVLLILVGLGFALAADRVKSQSFALLAILLSFYTASINPQPGFALFSNIVLITAALVLLLRHEWIMLSFFSLVGAYGSFAYWQFVRAGSDAPEQGLATILSFLLAYWVLFTLCVFLSRSEKLRGATRASYLTTNNGAFFGLASAAVANSHTLPFWNFALICGVVLLLLAWAAWVKDQTDTLFDGSYLAQGLALTALGVAAHFSGYQLSAMFGVESALLIYLSRFRHRYLLTLFSLLAGSAAFLLALVDVNHPAHVFPAIIFLLLGAILSKRGVFQALSFSPLTFLYAAGGLVLAGICAEENLSPELAIILFTGAAMALSFTLRQHRLPEIALTGQGYLVAADLLWMGRDHPAFALSALVLIANFALMHGWQRRGFFAIGEPARILGEMLWALLICAQLYLWLSPSWEGAFGLPYLALLATSLLTYGMLTASWPLAMLSILFTALCAGRCLQAFWDGPGHPGRELLTIGLLAAQHGIVSWRKNRLGETAQFYLGYAFSAFRLLICLLLIAFIFARIPHPWQPPAFALAAMLAFLLAHFKKGREPLAYCLTLAAGFFALFLIRTLQHKDLGIVSVLPLLAVIALQAVGKRTLGERFPHPAQMAILWGGVLVLFFFTTWQMWDRHLGHLLTIAWTLLAVAVTVCGFLLRERLLRLQGLGILALAVLHLYLIDVWQTELVYRTLSFIVLGLLILGVGLLYNKISAAVKKWL